MTATRGEVRYGTAGWSFEDWHGPFYTTREARDEGPGALFAGKPAAAPDPDAGLARRDPLAYYARWFDLVEVNASFYRTPDPDTVAKWMRTTRRETGAPFLFTFKLPQPFTHERRLDNPEVDAFLACLHPARAEGRLAGLLAQFPHAFRWDHKTRRHLERLAERFAETAPLVVEVRHRSWDDEGARAFLRDLDLCLCNVDQPPVDASVLEPAARVTSSRLGYVRMHGRNVAAWFAKDAGRDARYDYLYAPDELAEWNERIELLSGMSERTLVIANNHFRGQAPANALELRRMREGAPIAVPPALARAFPRLGSA